MDSVQHELVKIVTILRSKYLILWTLEPEWRVSSPPVSPVDKIYFLVLFSHAESIKNHSSTEESPGPVLREDNQDKWRWQNAASKIEQVSFNTCMTLSES